jgi:class 3 adenylate cyclase
VTFAFTDIVGSTRLLRRLGDAYTSMLERHRSLLRATWTVFDGVEVNAVGDGSLVAFQDASAAILACDAAQRRIEREQWAGNAVVRVRMGIHRGPATPWRGDYAALAVHQAYRIMAVAGGGQVLVSDVAARAAGTVPGLKLVPIGPLRLRDFDEPVALFEVERRESFGHPLPLSGGAILLTTPDPVAPGWRTSR